jgi:hypothetical protein
LVDDYQAYLGDLESKATHWSLSKKNTA